MYDIDPPTIQFYPVRPYPVQPRVVRAPWVLRKLWIGGVGLWVYSLLFVWAPATRMGGQLNAPAAILLFLGGLGLIVLSVAILLTRINQETGGMVTGLFKAFGTGYLIYKVSVPVARHVYREVTRD